MPNRVLKDTTASENVNGLTWQAEVFFYRLIMKADDFGNFHGNVKLVKAGLFPLRDSVRDADVVRWIAECEKFGLIAIYGAENKSYLRIIDFGQRLRTMKRKFPAPPENVQVNKPADNPPQSAASCSNPPPETEVETETEVEITVVKNFFRIGLELYKTKISDYLKENHKIFLEGWQMSHPEKILTGVLSKLDADYNTTHFSNQNHLKNTFKSVWGKVKEAGGSVVSKPGKEL